MTLLNALFVEVIILFGDDPSCNNTCKSMARVAMLQFVSAFKNIVQWSPTDLTSHCNR